jgi:hypothetical protein
MAPVSPWRVATRLAAGAGALTAPGHAQRIPDLPTITLELADRDEFRRGDVITVFMRSTTGGHVAVLRANTDGRLEVLFPTTPDGGTVLPPGERVRIPSPRAPDNDETFVVDEYPGVGYLFAIIADQALDVGAWSDGLRWDRDAMAAGGRIAGDPYVALAALAEQILPPESPRYGFDVAQYYVGRRYAYPRFVCYECHQAVGYPVWDPYRDWCGTFRLVIDDRARVLGPADPFGLATVLPPRDLRPQFTFTRRGSGDAGVVRVTDGAVPLMSVPPVPRDAARVGRTEHPAGPRGERPAVRPRLERRVEAPVPARRKPRPPGIR